MRENMHFILSVFSIIADEGHQDFLIRNFLHPEYADFSITFDGFNPLTGYYKEMIKTEGNKRQYVNNARRYIRISFESLLSYQSKSNRNLKLIDKDVNKKLEEVLNLLNDGNEPAALKKLYEILAQLASDLEKKFKSTD